MAGYHLSPSVRVQWLEDGGHDFSSRKGSGRIQQQNWAEAVDQIAAFVESL